MDTKFLNTSASLKLFVVLIMLYLTIALTCNLLAYKMVKLGDAFLMGSAFLFPLLYVTSNVMTEFFGARNTRVVVLLCMVCDFIFIFLTLWIIHLASPAWWVKQNAYNVVLDPMAQLYAAGVLATLVSTLFNIFVMQKLQQHFGSICFIVRSAVSSSLGILVYTVIADIFAFVLQMNIEHVLEVTVLNLVSNVGFVVFYALLIGPLVLFLKRKVTVG